MIQLSLIVITSGSNRLILEMIESIIDWLESENLELIIVSSGKYEFKKYKNLQPIILELNEFKGYSFSCNRGAELANGEFLFFLNDDLIFFPSTLPKILNFLKGRKNKDWLQSNIFGPRLLNKDGSIQYSMFQGFTTSFRRSVYRYKIQRKILQLLVFLTTGKYFTFWGNTHPIPRNSIPYDHLMGAAVLISQKLFNSGPKWDESIFLTLEDQLLCFIYNKKLNSKVYLIPNVDVIHLGNMTVKNLENVNEIFEESWKYFREKIK